MQEQQNKLFNFIKSYKMSTGQAPTFDEMKKHMELNSNQVIDNLLLQLEKQGFIERKKGVPRGINVTKESKLFVVNENSVMDRRHPYTLNTQEAFSINLWRLDGSN